MKIYRVFALSTAKIDAPVAHVFFMQAIDYKAAWENSRAILNGETKYQFFTDRACKTKATHGSGKNWTVAKIVKPEEEKVALIDPKVIAAIMADAQLSAEQKTAKIAALVS